MIIPLNTNSRVAEIMGIGTSTVSRWLEDEFVPPEYRAAWGEAVKRVWAEYEPPPLPVAKNDWRCNQWLMDK